MVKYPDGELDCLFKALSEPVRRTMINRLRLGSCTVSQLNEYTGVTLVATLKHVEMLERCGVIETKKEGRTRTCTLRPENLEPAESWLKETRTFWMQNLKNLHATLERSPE